MAYKSLLFILILNMILSPRNSNAKISLLGAFDVQKDQAKSHGKQYHVQIFSLESLVILVHSLRKLKASGKKGRWIITGMLRNCLYA